MNDIDPDKLAAALYKLIAASMNDGQLSSVYTFNHDDDDMYFGVDGYVDCRDLAKMIIKELEK